MKKLLFIFLLGLSIVGNSQTKIRTGEILFTTTPTPADTVSTTSAGRLRYDPLTGKYRFWNGLTNTWFSYGTGSGSAVTASGGLNKVGNDIRLGGSLIENTLISSTTFNLDFEKINGTIESYFLLRDGGILLNRLNTGVDNAIEVDDNSARFYGSDQTNISSLIVGSNGAIDVLSDFSNFAGIKYGSNFSANFTARSLVDKAYVDAAVAGGGSISGTGTTNELTYWTGASSLGSLTTATYPSLTELSYVKGLTSSAQTQLGTKWHNSGTTTLTGATEITGSSSNTLKFNFNSLGVTQTNGAGIWLANNTAATLGNQQISPSLVFEGNGWSTGSGISQSTRFAIDVLPGQAGTTVGTFNLKYSLGGAAYSTIMSIAGNGSLNAINGFTVSGLVNMTASSINYIGSNYQSGATRNNFISNGAVQNNTAGTVTVNAFVASNSLLSTGGGTADYVGFKATPSVTTINSIKGFEYAPTGTFTGLTSELAFHSTRGQNLFGHTSMDASTIRTQIRGIGNTTGYTLLLEGSTGTDRWAWQDNGVLLLAGSAGTSGQVLTSQGSGTAPIWSSVASGDMILNTAQTSTGKKTFQGDATNAGIRVSGSLEPSTKINGDLWLETSLRGYFNGVNATFMTMSSNGITNTRIPFGTGNFWSMTDAPEFTWTDTGNKSLNITGTANLGLGVNSFGTSADNVLGIGNGTPPSSSPVDMIQLYAENVAASSELKVRDEAGNVTTLSPHNFSIIGKPSEPGAFSHYSEYTNPETGKREAINIDILKLARLLEELTGEKLVYKKVIEQ